MTKENNAVKKVIPEVGTPCYLRQFTGSYYVDLVKRPYTVVSVSPKEIVVQSARCIFPVFHYDPSKMTPYYAQFDGKRICFYNTIAESVEPDPTGRLETLVWHPKRGLWGTPGPDSQYPEYAIIGSYEHYPYLD